MKGQLFNTGHHKWCWSILFVGLCKGPTKRRHMAHRQRVLKKTFLSVTSEGCHMMALETVPVSNSVGRVSHHDSA
eukprot:1196266-Prorocentrum_minimum.AAC.2